MGTRPRLTKRQRDLKQSIREAGGINKYFEDFDSLPEGKNRRKKVK